LSDSQLTKETLSTGDIVICVPVGLWSDGMEATIIGTAAGSRFSDNRSGSGYLIEIGGRRLGPTGRRILRFANELAKKKPPREDLQLIRWDTCPWQPEEISV
jgi:hypothetical protein